jgi:4-hydroxybenzoate polyprenyltransferase
MALVVVAASSSLAYAYGINAIFDRHTDLDRDKNVLAGRETVALHAIASVTGVGAFALLLGGSLGARCLVAIAVSIAFGTMYSAGPRLKRFPAVGLVANVLIFAPLLFAAVEPDHVPRGLRLLAVVFVLLLAQNQLLHEQEDEAEDELGGVMTTGRWLGPFGVKASVVALAAAIACAGALAGTATQSCTCAVAAVATALLGASAPAATSRRRAHRYLASAIGAALFLTSVY